MKMQIFQGTDIETLSADLNEFNDSHNVKYTQHSTAYDSKKECVVLTVIFFYE